MRNEVFTYSLLLSPSSPIVGHGVVPWCEVEGEADVGVEISFRGWKRWFGTW